MTIAWPQGEHIDLPCPVCDTAGPQPVLLRTSNPDHTLLRCRSCTACFYQHRSPPDYAADEPTALFMQFYVEQNAGLHHMSRFLYKIDDPGITSVLDFGCGFGFPVDVASKVLGWRAVGVDPSHYARDGRALLGADIRREYLTDATELGEPFDLLLGSEVIEHIPDLYPFMALLRRWMQPGGHIVLTTPDAGSLSPAVNEGMLTAMLSVGAHLVLFSAQAMEVMLRRAGFQHVHCECAGNNLVAYASDRPLRFRADADVAHFMGYRAYLQRLLDTAEPGGSVWNGAAGRLFAIDAGAADITAMLALWARATEAWKDRFGFDLARHRLPPRLTERDFGVPGPALVERLCAAQPLNLAGMLYNRALLERRIPGTTPEQVLAYARPAYVQAVQTCRALQEYGLIDYDLTVTAWRSRGVIVECLIQLAPEQECVLLAGLAAPAPGALGARIDMPANEVLLRIAGCFTRMVHAVEYDEAMRLEPYCRDLDLVCAVLWNKPTEMLHMLFCVGVLRLNRIGDYPGSLAAFQRMAAEAEAASHDPARAAEGAGFLPVAQHHVQMVQPLVPARPDPAAPDPAPTGPAPIRPDPPRPVRRRRAA